MSHPTFDNVVVLPVVRVERAERNESIEWKAFNETGQVCIIVPESLRIDMRAIARKENLSIDEAASVLLLEAIGEVTPL